MVRADPVKQRVRADLANKRKNRLKSTTESNRRWPWVGDSGWGKRVIRDIIANFWNPELSA